jgi:hypothetical protein
LHSLFLFSFLVIAVAASVDLDWFTSVHPEIVDFGSGQGLSVFAIPPKAGLRVSIPRIAKKRKRRPGTKDAVSGSTLTGLLHNPGIV